MEWIVIYWLATQSADAPPLYLQQVSFGSLEYCEEFAAAQDDWGRFTCAKKDNGPVILDTSSIDGSVSWRLLAPLIDAALIIDTGEQENE